MPLVVPVVVAVLAAARPGPPLDPTAACIGCHARTTPGIVSDWRLSRHAAASVGCDDCHGTDHETAQDAARARLPTPDACGRCHAARLEQYRRSKHALAWAAMMAMPTFHRQPPVLTDGLIGCGGCHAIGLKEEADQRAIARVAGRNWGTGACDSCHTRHTFSVKEAREPQACKSCHTGFDHAQWEMYASSKHGVRRELVQMGALPRDAAAPSCQTCHMPGGDHGVVTAWGFLGVRLPLPEDPGWRADQTAILKALGVLDPSGKPTQFLEVVKGARVARVTDAEWRAERERMVEACTRCHADGFARSSLERGDRTLREADRMVAEAIGIVEQLYRDGLLTPAPGKRSPFPDVLAFHDAPTPVEQRLFEMFMEHRARAFQGAFHQSPDQALWYGWSALQRDLADIQEAAARMRRDRQVDRKLGIGKPAGPDRARPPASR